MGPGQENFYTVVYSMGKLKLNLKSRGMGMPVGKDERGSEIHSHAGKDSVDGGILEEK